jgi:hypothetical protein
VCLALDALHSDVLCQCGSRTVQAALYLQADVQPWAEQVWARAVQRREAKRPPSNLEQPPMFSARLPRAVQQLLMAAGADAAAALCAAHPAVSDGDTAFLLPERLDCLPRQAGVDHATQQAFDAAVLHACMQRGLQPECLEVPALARPDTCARLAAALLSFAPPKHIVVCFGQLENRNPCGSREIERSLPGVERLVESARRLARPPDLHFEVCVAQDWARTTFALHWMWLSRMLRVIGSAAHSLRLHLTWRPCVEHDGPHLQAASVETLVDTAAALTQLRALELENEHQEGAVEDALRAILRAILCALPSGQLLELKVPSSLFREPRAIASWATPGTAVFTHLTSLSWRCCEFDVFPFSECRQLRRLRLIGGSACEYLPALQGLSQLVDLDLDNVYYGNEGAAFATWPQVAHVLQHMPVLQSLRCCSHSMDPVDAGALCAVLTSAGGRMTRLALPHCYMGYYSELLPNGERIGDFDGRSAAPLAKGLGALTALRELDLSSARLGSADLRPLVPVIASLSQLECLHISIGDMSDEQYDQGAPRIGNEIEKWVRGALAHISTVVYDYERN